MARIHLNDVIICFDDVITVNYAFYNVWLKHQTKHIRFSDVIFVNCAL